MNPGGRFLEVGTVYRYSSNEQPGQRILDGLPNFYWVTDTPNMPKVKLDSGIGGPEVGHAADPIPVTMIRSSPWKAGTTDTPWRDSFSPGNDVLQYHGDNKIDEKTLLPRELDPTRTTGNRRLLKAYWLHQSTVPHERSLGGPVLVFTGVPVKGRTKGNVRFDGLAVVSAASFVLDRDDDGRRFRNLLFDLRPLDLAPERNRLDWGWLANRRAAGAADIAAPSSWIDFVRHGLEASRFTKWLAGTRQSSSSGG